MSIANNANTSNDEMEKSPTQAEMRDLPNINVAKDDHVSYVFIRALACNSKCRYQ